MTRDDVRTRVHAILAEQASDDAGPVTDDNTLADLGIDSMGLVETIFVIEEAFDIQVPFNANAPDAEGFDISSVGAIVGAVDTLVDRQHG
ncbi:MAG: acyl carrier protein [Jannaschia sp.]